MLNVVSKHGDEDLAVVYIAQSSKGLIEFAESVQPPLTRDEKWVIIISCLVGCPVRCLMCDAGREYKGRLSKEEMFEQIDYLVDKRFPEKCITSEKFKVQFTRMGEPVFNPAVLEVLTELPSRYRASSLIPSFSTIGPANYERFFTPLKEIKDAHYSGGNFQMQFSIHTTDVTKRDQLIPVPKMSFEEIAEYGKEFFEEGDRKITLNFIVMEDYPVEPAVIAAHFDPSLFIIKMTPLNPTRKSQEQGLKIRLNPHDESTVSDLVNDLHTRGFDTIVSIGDLQENEIGSNCGMFVSAVQDTSALVGQSASFLV